MLREVGKHPWVGRKLHACHGHVHWQHGVRHADASIRHVHGQHRHMGLHEAVLQRFSPVQLLELGVLSHLGLRLTRGQASANLAAVSFQGSRRCWGQACSKALLEGWQQDAEAVPCKLHHTVQLDMHAGCRGAALCQHLGDALASGRQADAASGAAPLGREGADLWRRGVPGMAEQTRSPGTACQAEGAGGSPAAAGPAQSRSEGGGQPRCCAGAPPPRPSSGSGRCLRWSAPRPVHATGG